MIHKIETHFYVDGVKKVTTDESATVESGYVLEANVANATTDGLHACAIDVSQMQTAYLWSSRDITIKTNSSGSPAATITLKAGSPLKFKLNGSTANPFGATDVTALYITNASGQAALVKIYVGIDPTV